MRKSQSISLTLMAGLVAACSDGRSSQEVASGGDFGGASDEPRRCVDDQSRVVNDSLCTRPRPAGGGFYPYFFYFGGRSILSGGTAVMTGGTRTAVGAARSGRGAVSRGGIGARGAGRGGSIGG